MLAFSFLPRAMSAFRKPLAKREEEMLRHTAKPASSLQCAIMGWLALNENELTWIALVVGGVAFVGLFMSPAGLIGS
jgi:hypothetical protein